MANELGMDQYEFRLKNANRIGDTSPNRIKYMDPSTVDVVKAIADAEGRGLEPALAGMSRDVRTGDMLPDHLKDQLDTSEGGH